MPTYEYACRGCGRSLEVVQSFHDAPLTTCESCGGELRKVFSAAGLIFKGSGWHIKDYAGKGGSGGATSSGAKADAGSGTSAASDASSGTSSTGATSDGGGAATSAGAGSSGSSSSSSSSSSSGAGAD